MAMQEAREEGKVSERAAGSDGAQAALTPEAYYVVFKSTFEDNRLGIMTFCAGIITVLDGYCISIA
jgi:hypothetical protein